MHVPDSIEALLAEYQRLRAENDRLRNCLVEHGIALPPPPSSSPPTTPQGIERTKLVRASCAVAELRQSGLAQLVVIGETLHSWSEEIGRMGRFTRSNGITEGFHNKMKTISRQAYGFLNFGNYRQRVRMLRS